jgi:hypothetical protein
MYLIRLQYLMAICEGQKLKIENFTGHTKYTVLEPIEALQTLCPYWRLGKLSQPSASLRPKAN